MMAATAADRPRMAALPPFDPKMKSEVHESLSQGCKALNLPRSVAEELLNFLWLRKSQEREVTSKREKYRLGFSPGTSLDELWHWMLMNTKVLKDVQ
jgi:hypothetical protein